MMLVRYPSVEKSIYATVESFNYQVKQIIHSTNINPVTFLCIFQIWLGIILSLMAVFGCSWLILFIGCRFFNPESQMQETTIKIFTYFFKVILQQGFINHTIKTKILFILILWGNQFYRNKIRKNNSLDGRLSFYLESGRNCYR